MCVRCVQCKTSSFAISAKKTSHRFESCESIARDLRNKRLKPFYVFLKTLFLRTSSALCVHVTRDEIAVKSHRHRFELAVKIAAKIASKIASRNGPLGQ